MEYDQIEKDFVDRTLHLINEYKGEYEVTLLINCCLGLLVLPKEKHYKTVPEQEIPESGKLWGISKKSLTVDCGNCGYKLIEILRKLRNGICHFNVKTIPNGSGVITEVEIKDRGKFKAVLSTDQLRELAVSFGNHVISHNKSPQPTPKSGAADL